MKTIPFSILLVAALFASAAPQPATSVIWSQNAATHDVTVSFTLPEAAIVTAEYVTNGVVATPVTRVAGDVNRSLAAGAHSFLWSPDRERVELAVLPANAKIRLRTWSAFDPPDYMLVSLVIPGAVLYYASVEALPFDIGSDRWRQDDLLLRRIPAANVRWRMGCAPGERGSNVNGLHEQAHYVTLTRDYYMGAFEITQHQWYRLMAGVKRTDDTSKDLAYPSKYAGCADCRALRPVEQVNLEDIRGSACTSNNWPNADETVAHAVRAGSFVDRLRKVTGYRFDLPTEAQWEYACRAGTTSALHNGKEIESDMIKGSSTNLMEIARFAWNSGTSAQKQSSSTHWTDGATARVGSYKPNDWGLYDMLGNVREWVLGWSAAQTDAEEVDPLGVTRSSSSGSLVYRSGAIDNQPCDCRSAWRGNTGVGARWNTIGFRLVLEIEPAVGPVLAEEE